MNTLERIQIVGLHQNRTIDAIVENNTLILVGENGSGKTTFLRIVFFLLSGRWTSLLQFKFQEISIIINSSQIRITYEQIESAFKSSERRMFRDLPPSVRHRVMEAISSNDMPKAYLEIERVAERYGIPRHVLMQSIDISNENIKGPQKHLQNVTKLLRENFDSQILYLPTYRRIERELNSIFEGVDQDEIRRQRTGKKQAGNSEVFIELVEFGMKDVQDAIDRTLGQLKDFARESLNTLTLNYLGSVVNREYQSVNVSEIEEAPEETVTAVLNRIDDKILSNSDKAHLSGVISSARVKNSVSEHEKILYHYFLKLLRFQESLQERESRISNFCDLCSEYITDKNFIYNSADFSFSINSVEPWDAERNVDLSDLSSGEKQIVSLFSHLYLSGKEKFFVLIDEPELSLSVPWQRRFLKDIRNGGFCSGLIAVTHSPFIYDNDLKPYAHSLGEFISY
jgi:predicted ATP-dependent endonuclease of OLD family